MGDGYSGDSDASYHDYTINFSSSGSVIIKDQEFLDENCSEESLAQTIAVTGSYNITGQEIDFQFSEGTVTPNIEDSASTGRVCAPILLLKPEEQPMRQNAERCPRE